MIVRNPHNCIANVPYETKAGEDPQPIEVPPNVDVVVPDNYFDDKSEPVKQAFIEQLKNGRLVLVQS